MTVLIFGGKILKDPEDIRTHDIKDGQTIHLVIRNKPTTDSSNNPTSLGSGSTQHRTTTTTNTSASNVSANNLNDNNNIPNRQEPPLNPLLGDLGDVQQRLQQMLISNPETMQNMINPMMQQMMNNPNMMSSLFGSMQRMQMLMERNPEVNHLLSNPDVLRESLEMARNPAALQEVMRNYDRALNNMESMPGGYNVLRRMYTEFQEPLMSAFQEQFSSNQFSPQSNTETTGANSDGNGGNVEQQRRENRDPLPNPWATPSQQQQTTTTTDNNNIPNLRQDPSINPLLANLGSVQQSLQQILTSNPETMQNMMQQMMNNPNMMGSLFGGMQRMQTLMEHNPELNQLLSNPDVLREHLEMASNPAALQEMMRNQDRAMNNMESMPGGFDALRRMYSEFQEPLMNAFQDQLGANLFSPQAASDTNANNNNNNSNSEPQRTENRDPLPNPWADRSQQTTRTTTTTRPPPDSDERKSASEAAKKEKKPDDEESKDEH